MTAPSLVHLLRRFAEEGVDYALIGGQAVRLHGFSRATEDVDVLIRTGRDNGERIRRALDFLSSARDIDASWFEPVAGEIENIRVADALIVDLLFAANGHTYESMQSHILHVDVEGVAANILDIDGLLQTKTDYREKDVLDKRMLQKIQQGLVDE